MILYAKKTNVKSEGTNSFQNVPLSLEVLGNVEAWLKNISIQFSDGQTHSGIPRDAKMSLAQAMNLTNQGCS